MEGQSNKADNKKYHRKRNYNIMIENSGIENRDIRNIISNLPLPKLFNIPNNLETVKVWTNNIKNIYK